MQSSTQKITVHPNSSTYNRNCVLLLREHLKCPSGQKLVLVYADIVQQHILFFLKYCPWVYMHGSFHTLKIQLITYFPPLNFRKSATKWVDLSIASSILDIQIVCVSFSSFTFDSSLSLCGLGCFFWHENCERTKKKPNKTGKKRNVFVCYVGNQIKTIMCTWWYKRMQSLTLEFLHALHPHLVNSHTQLSIVCCTSPNTHSVCVCLFSHFVSTNKKTRISMLIT